MWLHHIALLSSHAGASVTRNVTMSTKIRNAMNPDSYDTLPSQRGWAFSLAGKNLFDARVFDPGLDAQALPVIPQPGRQLVLSLERRL